MVLTICIILFTSVSVFAAGFGGGGFGGGVRSVTSYTSGFDSDTIATKLSYSALEQLAVDVNMGIATGEIVLEPALEAVAVGVYEPWNAYVILGHSRGVTYVLVNASGGRYYSPINDGYSIVAIAGASSYYQTDRPAGTVGGGYLGDLQVTYNEWMNIKNQLDSISGTRFYYAMGHSINGQYRYYMTPSGMSNTYYVCNSAGQLFYYLKDDGSTEDPGGGGSTFDPTEVITAINSVYDAINSQGSRLSARFTELITSTNSISNTLNMHMNNVVGGFNSLQGQLTTLSSYFSELSGLFPVQETLTLSGSDARVAWDSADRITDVSLSGFGDGDFIVKQYPGALVDESGYEKVELSPDTTEYTLSTVEDYRRVTANIEYPDSGPSIPDSALFYFPFDDTLSSSVGNITLNAYGNAKYSTGVDGQAFLFDGSTYLGSTDYIGNGSNFGSNSFTMSVWLKIPRYPANALNVFSIKLGNTYNFGIAVDPKGTLRYFGLGSTTAYLSGQTVVPLNEWFHVAITFDGGSSTGTFRGFLNGSLDASGSATVGENVGPIYIRQSWNISNSTDVYSGTMIDNLLYVYGSALWTSNFDPYEDAIFSEVAADYFLPCTDQTIGLVFDDTLSKTLAPTDVNGNAITMGRLMDDFSEIYYDVETSLWMCHDPQTQTEILLSSANQEIMNDTIYIRQSYVSYAPDQVTANTLQSAFPVDAPVYVDMPESAKVTITYDHYSGWFRMMYLLMDKQTQLLTELDIVNNTIVDIDNTIIDISPDNDAFNIFYIEKTDGSKESVGDAALDTTRFVGDVLSMFYRLVFDDALDNMDLLDDFEGAFSSEEVTVW